MKQFKNVKLLQSNCDNNVFYCDFMCADSIHSEHLRMIEESVNAQLKKGVLFQSIDMIADNAAEYFQSQGQLAKATTLREYGKSLVSLVRVEDYIDFIFEQVETENNDLNFIKLVDIVEDKNVKRIYGVAGVDKMEIKQSLKAWEASLRYDGIKILEQKKWISIDNLGNWFWMPNGCRLQEYIKDLMRKRYELLGFEKVNSFGNMWDKLVRNETICSSVKGDFRYYEFCRSDIEGSELDLAVWRCNNKNLKQEIISCLQFFKEIATIFSFDKRFYILRKEGVLQSKNQHGRQCQKLLEDALLELGEEHVINKSSEDVFGPTIAMVYVDRWGRHLYGAHITINSRCSEAYNEVQQEMSCSIIGDLERFIVFLLENFKGDLPLLFLPDLVRVLTVDDNVCDYAKEVVRTLKESNIKVTCDFSSCELVSKIRDACHEEVPYIVVVGESEKKNNHITVRELGKKAFRKFALADFIEQLLTRLK